MRTKSSNKSWLALTATLAVFAVVLAFANRQTDSAPLSPRMRPVAMFGGGPSRNLVNLHDKDMPISWSVKAGKEKNVLWSERLGTKAYGGPVIFGGKIFVGTNNGQPRDPAIGGDKGVLMCFDEKTGNFLWQAVHDKLASGRVNDWPEEGIVSTSAVEGDRLYYVSNRCEVVCAKTAGLNTGKADIVWRLDMIGKLNVFPHNVSSCSPLLVEDMLFVVTGNGVDEGLINLPKPNAPSFLAINKKTGEVVWQSNLPRANIRHGQWSNPVYAEVSATPMVVFPGGDGWLYAFDPPTGRLLWKFDCNPIGALPREWNHFIATPVVWGNKLYIGVGSYHENGKGVGHIWCVDLVRAVEKGCTNVGSDVSPVGNNFDPKARVNLNSALAWHYGGANPVGKPRPYHFGRTLSACAVHGGLVYAADYDGWLYCLDGSTGEKYWDHDMKADTRCSPYWVDGKIYIGNDNGEMLIFEHGKKKTLLKSIGMGAGVLIRTPPIAANGVLYVVTENPCKLYALRSP